MAGTSLEAFSGNAVSSIRRLTLNQQLAMAGAFVVVIGLILFVGRMGGSSSMGILYSDLEPEVAAGVVDELESRGIDYELSDSGRVVWVPRDQVSSTRLDMSAAGLPDSSSGWSILDNQGITSSEFDQRVGYQRAMEGELASTISVIDGVKTANVHLVIPEQDLFVGDEIKASASVLLQMESSEPLAPTQIQAVVNLIASSVEGLSSDDVTITDDAGRLLAGGDEDGLAGMESDNQVRMRETFESDVERELTALLEAVVGPGRSVVTVNADLDFDTVITTEETYNEPVNSQGETLPQAETTRIEQYNDGSGEDGGVVSIETQILDGPEAETGGAANYSLSERDVSYALDSVVTSTEKAPGTIRALSVAVAIDEELVDADRLPEIQDMVSVAVGASLERGDQVAVSLLPFEMSLEEQEAAEAEALAAGTSSAGSLGLIRTVGAIIIAIVVLVLGLLLLRRASRRTVIDSIDLESLPTGTVTNEEGRVISLGNDSEIREPTEDDLLELVANQPEDIAGVLRQWLTQPETTTQ